LETQCSGGDSSSAPLTRREEALQRRLEESERLVAKLQLAASLQELQQVTGTLDTTTCAAASTVADSPASERRSSSIARQNFVTALSRSFVGFGSTKKRLPKPAQRVATETRLPDAPVTSDGTDQVAARYCVALT
jgi:hypothetical protein